ncbi:unnamed protein product [Ostreobium quekettii]|uniref:Uncharacterized protein n=1 Tax=Ostreobium quekettii TaxID=121088 RepID=A0A8S1J6T4_9CHLO|nr:unnamed protein product [Ostreobium quekettii]
MTEQVSCLDLRHFKVAIHHNVWLAFRCGEGLAVGHWSSSFEPSGATSVGFWSVDIATGSLFARGMQECLLRAVALNNGQTMIPCVLRHPVLHGSWHFGMEHLPAMSPDTL